MRQTKRTAGINRQQSLLSQVSSPSLNSQSISSSKSILSDKAVDSSKLEEIKQSTVKPREKKVTLWTPVIVQNRFPLTVKPLNVQYSTSQKLNSGEVPPVVSQLPRSLILNLPLEGIKPYLSERLELASLPSDDELVKFLEYFLL
jgi:hypothetical protein